MGIIILIVVAVFIAAAIYLIRRSANKKRTAEPPASATAVPEDFAPPEQKTNRTTIRIDQYADDHQWLKERWEMAEEHRKTEDRSIFPEWYYDPMTSSQKKWLEKEGIQVDQPLTKGHASDLIDLHHPASAQQLEILNFFNIPLPKDLNHTRAMHELSLLFRDPEKQKAWNQRPPSQLQKERARFFGVKLPKEATESQAELLISDKVSVLEEKDDPRVDEWDSIENIIHRLSDEQDLKEVFSIKKPGIALIITALEKLQEEGQSYVHSEDNIESVVQKLVELKPDLRLNS